MLKLLGNFAKGVAKKKVKKKGGEMAQNIMGSKKENAIVVRQKKTTLAPRSGGALDTPIQKPKSEGSPLDRIDSALLDIINTLKGRRKLMLSKSRKMRQQADKEKKGKREGVLENVKNMGKKMVGDVVATASGWWEKLQRFLLMTLLGSLVVAIKENWEAIKVQIDKVVNFVQDLWKFMSPVLIPLFQALKWVTVEGFKLIGNMLGMGKDKAQIDKGTDEVSDGLNKIKEKTSMVTSVFKKTDKDVRSLGDTKKGEVKDTKKGEVEGKTPPTPKRNRDEVTTDKTIKSDLSTITFDGKTYPRGLSGPNETFGGKGGSTYSEKKYNVGGYVHEDGEVHEGEYVVKESIVKKVGVTNIENVIKTMMLPGLGGGGGGTDAITAKATTKSLGKRGKDIGNLLARPFRDKTEADPRSMFASPDKMIENMGNTLTILKEQTDYEDPSTTTIIIPVPTPSQPPMSGGGGGDTEIIPVGASSKDTLNRYMSAVIQKALY